MKEVTVVCKRGNASVRVSSKGWTQVLTGKRRKWDTLHWSFFSDTSEIAIQGLWRGRYGDAIRRICWPRYERRGRLLRRRGLRGRSSLLRPPRLRWPDSSLNWHESETSETQGKNRSMGRN